jgi:hypothetical protein
MSCSLIEVCRQKMEAVRSSETLLKLVPNYMASHFRRWYSLNFLLLIFRDWLYKASLWMSCAYYRSLLYPDHKYWYCRRQLNMSCPRASGSVRRHKQFYGMHSHGVEVQVPVEAVFVSSSCRPDRFWGPPSLLSNGIPGAPSQGIERLGREADHSPPTSAEVTNIHPLPHTSSWCTA